MKNLFSIFIILLFVGITFGQQSQELVTIPKDMLTLDQKAKLEVQTQVQSAKEWTGIGKEIGEGANAIFGALNKNAVEFGESTPGIILLGILAWQIIGNDFIQIVVGFLIWLLIFVLFLYSYRKTCVIRPVVATKKRSGGTWLFNAYDKTYTTINDDGELSNTRLTHLIGFGLLTVLSAVIMFA